jgi:hypothetical protein
LVGQGGDDDVVLDCYWLAKWYGQNPEIFLNLRCSDVRRHMLRTSQLSERMERDRADD